MLNRITITGRLTHDPSCGLPKAIYPSPAFPSPARGISKMEMENGKLIFLM